MQERRRFPRRTVQNESVGLPAAMDVQLLDISVTGVLLQSSQPIEPSARGSLRVNFGGVPLTAEVEIQRVSVVPGDTPSYRIGARFLGMAPQHRQLIERFMVQ